MFDQFMLLDYFIKGGVVMYPLLLLSLVSVTLIIERIWFYTKIANQDQSFLREIEKPLQKEDLKSALIITNNYSSPVALTIRAGLFKRSQGRMSMEKAMQRMGLLQLARLEKGLGMISSIGNIAPLLGFLGTVIGMIKSFDVIAYQGLDNPALVAIGIKEALITTATGLIIAIPSLAAYNYFTGTVARIINRIEENAEELLDTMSEKK